MGQYFRLVNVDQQETVDVPHGIKLPEIMSSGLSCQVMAYLMFDGPFDGTTLLDRLYTKEDPKVQEGIEERIEQEVAIEEERKNEEQLKTTCLRRAIKYTDDHPFDEDDADITKLSQFPQQIIDKYEEKYKSRVYSTYREDNLNWRRDRIKRVVCAGFYTGEDSICGRWAGDDVRLIGDYAEDDYYSAMYGEVVVRLENGKLGRWTGPHPDAVEPLQSNEFSCRAKLLDREAEPGDMVRASRLDCGQNFAEFVEYNKNDWDNITASVFHEMARYMPDKFGELADKVGDPDIVFGSGRNER